MAEKKYFPVAEAAEMLGKTERDLRAYLPELQHGKHYQDRRKKGKRKNDIFINVQALEEYWDIPPELRNSKLTQKKA
jgi:predicted transcriptional regulator